MQCPDPVQHSYEQLTDWWAAIIAQLIRGGAEPWGVPWRHAIEAGRQRRPDNFYPHLEQLRAKVRDGQPASINAMMDAYSLPAELAMLCDLVGKVTAILDANDG